VIGRPAAPAQCSCHQTRHLHRETRVAYLFRVDPSEQLPAPEREILRSGPIRAPLLDRLTPAWRRRGVVLIAFVLGVIGGGGAAWWWDDRSPTEARAPSPPAAAGTEVRLVLSGVVAPTQPNDRNGTVGNGPLRIDGVLLHSRGPGIATVTRIHRAGGSLAIRVPALPVRLSSTSPSSGSALRSPHEIAGLRPNGHRALSRSPSPGRTTAETFIWTLAEITTRRWSSH
jgi:hypothetical protein